MPPLEHLRRDSEDLAVGDAAEGVAWRKLYDWGASIWVWSPETEHGYNLYVAGNFDVIEEYIGTRMRLGNGWSLYIPGMRLLGDCSSNDEHGQSQLDMPALLTDCGNQASCTWSLCSFQRRSPIRLNSNGQRSMASEQHEHIVICNPGGLNTSITIQHR